MNFRYYFGFTRGQYKGLVLLLTINLCVIIYYFADDYLYKTKPAHDFSELIVYLDSVESSQSIVFVDSFYDFDPNAITADEFRDLGLDKNLADRIIKYKVKGGQFHQSTDLLKIYGMDSSWYMRAEPFVKIEKEEKIKLKKRDLLRPFLFDPNTVSLSELLAMGLNKRTAESWIKYLGSGGRFKNCEELEKLYLLNNYELSVLLSFCKMEVSEHESIQIVDINSSDSIELLKVRGVGPAFAHRIIEYRNLLGGYILLNQLNEIYGIDSLKYYQLEAQLSISDYSIKRLKINSDEFKVLLKHPYLTYDQVKSIVNYRNQLGQLNDFSELQHLEGFEVEDTIRLKPYISFEIK